jgi:hypothetical protein
MDKNPYTPPSHDDSRERRNRRSEDPETQWLDIVFVTVIMLIMYFGSAVATAIVVFLQGKFS